MVVSVFILIQIQEVAFQNIPQEKIKLTIAIDGIPVLNTKSVLPFLIFATHGKNKLDK